MAQDVTKIMVGAGVLSLGDYVTAGGAGSLSDAGFTLDDFQLTSNQENFDVEVEQTTGTVLTSKVKTEFTLKCTFAQAEAELLRVLLAQPSGNKSGTGANLTLRVGNAATQYHQATLVVPGPGTTGVRTLTFWKLQILTSDPIPFGKKVVQKYGATFRLLYDSTVSTADKFFKQVDA